MPTRRKPFIFAGNFRQAVTYAQLNDLKPNDWIYLNDEYKLMGYENPEVIMVGTYDERPDYLRIKQRIKERTRGN